MRYLCMLLSILLCSNGVCKDIHVGDEGLSYTALLERLEKDVPKDHLSQWQQNAHILAEKALSLNEMSSWRFLLEETLAKANVEGVIVEVLPQQAKGKYAKAEVTPVARLIEGRIGYLYLPDMTGVTFPAADFFQSLRSLCLRYAGRKLMGWILDLRDAGSYDAAGLWWSLRVLFPLEGEALPVTKQERRLQHTKTIPLAILLSEKTKYATEQIAANLLTRPFSKSFGSATLGERVLFEPVVLSRRVRVYLKRLPVHGPNTAPLIPQVPVKDQEGDQDHTLNEALKWLVSLEAPEEHTAESEPVENEALS
ncbi:MAG: hypothetical protein H2057_03610 [Alphaproteobacteria bacterium]|nr:hypothetical protein [Alphaproteobacteria bacterium]